MYVSETVLEFSLPNSEPEELTDETRGDRKGESVIIVVSCFATRRLTLVVLKLCKVSDSVVDVVSNLGRFLDVSVFWVQSFNRSVILYVMIPHIMFKNLWL